MDTLIVRAVVAAGLGAVLLTGCSGTDREAPSTESASQADGTDGTVLQPGRPGEPNRTVPPDTRVESAPANAADVAFVQQMIPHHQQALEMCELARTRAADPRVASLARRIQGAQGPEIIAMSSWLALQGAEVPGDHGSHGGHDGEMAGMLTDEQMAELAAARGPAFDRLFLAGMTQHHQGAVDMAHDALDAGSETLSLELAADIATGQLAEIRRMADLRRDL
ncbi:DUF305 domain-containing protein [Nocardioides coralli]|uniref:DUF305 domain-containing protein n=1 Tax=Nocardioides coralli TaxID=2872154 RepID=UPI001CA3C255|nr:DUF305 domain-containing protein [Nocardioides coralli]QZY29477.1 DUF305 domain-containing protein [Nocardioides coralli]